jgi:hypothetical protein
MARRAPLTAGETENFGRTSGARPSGWSASIWIRCTELLSSFSKRVGSISTELVATLRDELSPQLRKMLDTLEEAGRGRGMRDGRADEPRNLSSRHSAIAETFFTMRDGHESRGFAGSPDG